MLTSKQRAILRGMANKIDTIFQIGKGGVNENAIAGISDALEAREIIKLRTLNNCELSPREAAEEIARKTEAEVVSVIGTRFVLFRRAKKNSKIDISGKPKTPPVSGK